MTTMTRRIAPFCGTIALLAQVFVFQGCGGSNGGTTGSGGSATTGTGGAATTGTGGASATGGATGTGGASTTGTGGTTGSGGSGAIAACGNTTAGTAIGKSVPCTAADTQVCTKTCGPEKTGTKTETCSGTSYTEGDCTFDQTKNYMCYAIPAVQPADCPTTPAQASQPCSIADCIVCGGPLTAGGAPIGYLDSKGNAGMGYCVCQSNGEWSCATASSAWPCPSSNGC